MPTLLARTKRPRPAALAPEAATGHALQTARAGPMPGAVGQAFLAVPFDALRLQYAGAVMAGLVQRSILASARLERALDALERLILGPMARQR